MVKVCYCTIKRITHTSASLLVKPILGCLFNSKKMFFISANLYRSTGTNSRTRAEESYVNNLGIEMQSSRKLKVKNFPVISVKKKKKKKK